MSNGWTITYLPEPETVTYSLGNFLDSIERNGLPQITGDYWRGDGKKIGESLGLGSFAHHKTTTLEVNYACAFGQSALNLQVDYNALVAIIDRQFRTKHGRGLASTIISRNDGHKWKYKTIARFYREKFADRLNETFEIPRTISVQKG